MTVSYLVDDSMSDNELVKVAKEGDMSGVAQLYLRYRTDIRSIGFKVLRKEEDVEDFEMDMVLRLHEKIDIYKEGNFGAWYKSMIRRSVLNFKRYENLRVGEEYEDGVFGVRNTEYLVNRNKLGEIVRNAMSNLSDSKREVLKLRFWEEMSYKEIADRMDSNVIIVTSLLHRAKKSFRSYLDEDVVRELLCEVN